MSCYSVRCWVVIDPEGLPLWFRFTGPGSEARASREAKDWGEGFTIRHLDEEDDNEEYECLA